MAWDFSTDPEFQQKLDWMTEFVQTEIEPLDLAFSSHLVYDKDHPVHEKVVRPLQDEVRARDLWACHLGPELGGKGYGQLKLALMNEILGRSMWAPSVFGSQAPDSGNAEIIAHYGTDEQKEKYLQPLLDGRISSCYSMTEPQAGSDPQQFRCRAERDGDEWVINGEKWFTSAGRVADLLFVMCTNGMFVVPRQTPGVEIQPEPRNHNHIIYNDVRVPLDHLLGPEDGAKVRESLATRAASLRRRELAELQGQAGERSQSMLVAQMLLAGAFLIFLIYPAVRVMLGV